MLAATASLETRKLIVTSLETGDRKLTGYDTIPEG